MTDRATHPMADSFREVMSRVCTPVSIVTAMAGRRPHGTTVSAFNSLSMSPPMVLVSLAKTSDLLAHIKATDRFGLNILGRSHIHTARSFARKGEAKFESIDWTLDDDVPRLPMALGWLSCSVANAFDGGDHVILLGLVRKADSASGAPLTYYLREFGTHRALASNDVFEATA